MTIDEYKKEVKQIRPQMLFIAQSYLRDNDEAERKFNIELQSQVLV